MEKIIELILGSIVGLASVAFLYASLSFYLKRYSTVRKKQTLSILFDVSRFLLIGSGFFVFILYSMVRVWLVHFYFIQSFLLVSFTLASLYFLGKVCVSLFFLCTMKKTLTPTIVADSPARKPSSSYQFEKIVMLLKQRYGSSQLK